MTSKIYNCATPEEFHTILINLNKEGVIKKEKKEDGTYFPVSKKSFFGKDGTKSAKFVEDFIRQNRALISAWDDEISVQKISRCYREEKEALTTLSFRFKKSEALSGLIKEVIQGIEAKFQETISSIHQKKEKLKEDLKEKEIAVQKVNDEIEEELNEIEKSPDIPREIKSENEEMELRWQASLSKGDRKTSNWLVKREELKQELTDLRNKKEAFKIESLKELLKENGAIDRAAFIRLQSGETRISFEVLYDQDYSKDIVITCSDGKQIYAHREILNQIAWFKRKLFDFQRESIKCADEIERIQLDLSEYSSVGVEYVVKTLYKLEPTFPKEEYAEESVFFAEELIFLADYLGLKELEELCCHHLISLLDEKKKNSAWVESLLRWASTDVKLMREYAFSHLNSSDGISKLYKSQASLDITEEVLRQIHNQDHKGLNLNDLFYSRKLLRNLICRWALFNSQSSPWVFCVKEAEKKMQGFYGSLNLEFYDPKRIFTKIDMIYCFELETEQDAFSWIVNKTLPQMLQFKHLSDYLKRIFPKGSFDLAEKLLTTPIEKQDFTEETYKLARNLQKKLFPRTYARALKLLAQNFDQVKELERLTEDEKIEVLEKKKSLEKKESEQFNSIQNALDEKLLTKEGCEEFLEKGNSQVFTLTKNQVKKIIKEHFQSFSWKDREMHSFVFFILKWVIGKKMNEYLISSEDLDKGLNSLYLPEEIQSSVDGFHENYWFELLDEVLLFKIQSWNEAAHWLINKQIILKDQSVINHSRYIFDSKILEILSRYFGFCHAQIDLTDPLCRNQLNFLQQNLYPKTYEHVLKLLMENKEQLEKHEGYCNLTPEEKEIIENKKSQLKEKEKIDN